MYRNLDKTCMMCEKPIPRKYILCRSCFYLVKGHMHEQWFKDLLFMHKVQSNITRMEKELLRDDFIGQMEDGLFLVTEFPKGYRRKTFYATEGRPTVINEDLEQRCRDLRNQGLSYRKIAKIVGVSYVTVRYILLKN